MHRQTRAIALSTSRTRIVPRPVYAVIAILATSFVVAVVGDAESASIAGAVGTSVGLATAAWFFIVRSRVLERSERRAWTLVGAGLLVSSLGIVLVVLLVLVSGDAPTVGPLDLFFIIGYTVAIVGFALLPHTAGTTLQRLRIAIDGLIGAISVGALAWVLVLGPIFRGFSDAEPWERVIGSLYPILDLAAIVVFMIVLARRSSFRLDIRLVFFTAAIALQSIADVSYLVEAVGQSFASAEPLHFFFIAAAAAFLASALIVNRVPLPREYADRQVSVWALMAPYGAAVFMVLVLLVRLWDGQLDQYDDVLLVATLAVALLVVTRQGIAIRENRMIVERERTDLVSSISHELRTPLTATVGFVAVLQEDPKIDLKERIEMIDIVMEQTAYLERIVQDLLFLAEDDPSRLVLKTAPWRIAPIIENAILSSMIGRDGADVEVEPDLIATVDADRLQQVLVNLLANARRYGGDQCLVIARSDQGRLTLEVHDSGPGVPKKYELTIWDRFERGPNRYNAIEPGSGIGLAMVRSIAIAHGGRAFYRTSERLGGACFVVELAGNSPDPEPIATMPSSKLAIG